MPPLAPPVGEAEAEVAASAEAVSGPASDRASIASARCSVCRKLRRSLLAMVQFFSPGNRTMISIQALRMVDVNEPAN
ncbi:hypothetical protein [Rugamonas sp.]|uniref:hypothetical protein n=1 Tax=Rugamonas sp. TaxID=1926287 RepID=UPI0025F9CCF4|nr:hypothetical protein [Rugamonas sp.]